MELHLAGNCRRALTPCVDESEDCTGAKPAAEPRRYSQPHQTRVSSNRGSEIVPDALKGRASIARRETRSTPGWERSPFREFEWLLWVAVRTKFKHASMTFGKILRRRSFVLVALAVFAAFPAFIDFYSLRSETAEDRPARIERVEASIIDTDSEAGDPEVIQRTVCDELQNVIAAGGDAKILLRIIESYIAEAVAGPESDSARGDLTDAEASPESLRFEFTRTCEALRLEVPGLPAAPVASDASAAANSTHGAKVE